MCTPHSGPERARTAVVDGTRYRIGRHVYRTGRESMTELGERGSWCDIVAQHYSLKFGVWNSSCKSGADEGKLGSTKIALVLVFNREGYRHICSSATNALRVLHNAMKNMRPEDKH